jgi:hypothetical protein
MRTGRAVARRACRRLLGVLVYSRQSSGNRLSATRTLARRPSAVCAGSANTEEYLRSREHRTLSSDYMSEFRLRKIEPPMDLAKADFAKIQKAIKKRMKAMSKEAYLDFAAEVADDLDEFKSQRDRGKH